MSHPPSVRRRASIWLLAAALTLPGPVIAQFSDPPPPAAYALTGVTLVRADGSRTPNVTVVVRGKLIEALGPDAAIPADAMVLEGDSLTVYPGLVDAQGKAEHEFPKPDFEQDEITSWAPPREVQGLQPHRRVADVLTVSAQDLKSQRSKGVVAAAVHPSGPLMPGRGVFLLFRPNAATPRELVLRGEIAPLFSFERPSGVYPGTLFGAMAFFRQTFEDARRDGVIQETSLRDPRGMATPEWDPDMTVVRSVLGGNRVFFQADAAEDIRNVLQLSREYSLRPVIVGGEEAWRVAGLLREADVTVLVSLDFPKPIRWKPDAVPDSGQTQGPSDAAVEREKQEVEAGYRNAARLAEAGVTFALTSGAGKADVIEGARKTIEYGLTEQQALAALTTVPATLLEMPALVRLESGMPATFVATDGPLFEEDTRIAYTFVEGVMEKGAARRPGGGEAPAVNVSGGWDMTVDAGGQAFSGPMTLEQDGASFSGRLELEQVGSIRIVDGSVSGTSISFNLIVTMGGETANMEASGSVEGDRASGSGSGPLGTFRWSATRTSTPQRINP